MFGFEVWFTTKLLFLLPPPEDLMSSGFGIFFGRKIRIGVWTRLLDCPRNGDRKLSESLFEAPTILAQKFSGHECWIATNGDRNAYLKVQHFLAPRFRIRVRTWMLDCPKRWSEALFEGPTRITHVLKIQTCIPKNKDYFFSNKVLGLGRGSTR